MKIKIPKAIYILILIISVASIFISCFQDNYKITALLPISFVCAFAIVTFPKEKASYSITCICYLLFSFIRYVVIPLMGALSDYFLYDNILLNNESINIAILIMLIEIIFSAIVMCLIENNKKQHIDNHFNNSPVLKGSKLAYSILFIFTVMVYIFIGRDNDLEISFIFLDVTDGRSTGTVSPLVSVVNLFISSSLMFASFILINRFARQYDQTKNKTRQKMDLFKSIIVSLIPVCTIFGERRVTVLATAIAYTILLVLLFKKYQKKIVQTMAIFTLIVIIILSVYKMLNAFLYGSYLSAIKSMQLGIGDLACSLDSYFFGVKTVARNVTFANSHQVDLSNYFYDVTRNIFGLSFLLKGKGLTTSEIFNLFKSNNLELTGTLFSGCGYGYTFLSYLGAPIAICLRLFILSRIESSFRKLRSIEGIYIFGYTYATLAYFMYSSLVMQINSLSRFLICNGIIFIVACIRNGKLVIPRYKANLYDQ